MSLLQLEDLRVWLPSFTRSYFSATTHAESENWLKKFRIRLEHCEYAGESGVAAEAMLHSLNISLNSVEYDDLHENVQHILYRRSEIL